MVDLCDPLGHAIVVCIFRPERELEPASGDGAEHSPGGPSQAPVSSDLAQGSASIGYEPGAIFAVFKNVHLCKGRIRRAESRPDEVIIEVRRSQGNLSLLQSKKAVMVPGGLPESDKGKGVPLNNFGIGQVGRMDMGKKLRTKQAWRWFHGLEGPQLSKYLAAVVTRHPDRGDLSCPLVYVQIRRTADVSATIGKMNCSFRVVWETREKILLYRDHFERLAARPGYLPRQQDILTVAEHASERITGKRSRRRFLPCHDHPGVQTPGQRHPDQFLPIEVPRKISREDRT